MLSSSLSSSCKLASIGFSDGTINTLHSTDMSLISSINCESSPLCLHTDDDSVFVGTPTCIKIIPFGGDVLSVSTPGPVCCITSVDDKIFLGTLTGKVGIFSRSSNQIEYVSVLFGKVVDLCVSSSSLYVLGSDGKVYVLSLSQDQLLVTSVYNSDVQAEPLSLSCSDDFIGVTFVDGSAVLWNASSRQVFTTLKVSSKSKIGITKHGEVLFSNSEESVVYLIENGELVKQE
ncbi:hypothetical protein RCL1_008809 [Eukaryota sp. TZLM3-RCL]